MSSRILAAMAALTILAGCGKPSAPPEPAPLLNVVAPRTMHIDSPTLKAVKARGRLNCGVHQGLPGFAWPDNHGEIQGFDADFCRALAAAVLGDADAVHFIRLDTKSRFTALQAKQVDVLVRNTSWTFTRDAGLGLDFAGVNYYDGQGFLAPKSLNLQSAVELNGAKICVEAGTTTEQTLAEFFRSRGLKYQPVVLDTEEKARDAYQREACDAFSADVSALAAARSIFNNPQAHVILPDVISKEPLGPAVRQGDDAWADIVRWTLNALILAEELKITAKTVDAARKDGDAETRRLLGEDDYGAMLGLKADWAYQAISQVGNYGEIFERNLGPKSPLRLERGLNAQWNAEKPGLIYAPPMR